MNIFTTMCLLRRGTNANVVENLYKGECWVVAKRYKLLFYYSAPGCVFPAVAIVAVGIEKVATKIKRFRPSTHTSHV